MQRFEILKLRLHDGRGLKKPSRMWWQMKLSISGEAFIKSFESFSPVPYLDQTKKIWTIGWGHTDGVNQWTPQINRDQGEVLFSEDVEGCEECINEELKTELTQSEFDALVSFIFNEGSERFLTSTLLAKLRQGDKQGAAKEFARWIYYHDDLKRPLVSDGLVNRRAKEKALFLTDFLQTRSAPAE